MLYITPLVLIYLRNLYILTIFIYCSPTPASDNHKFGLFFYEFVCLFLTYNGIQHHVSFGYTKLWFFFYIISKWSLSSVQLHSCVWLFATPWTSAHQASLSITNSQSLLKLMSIASVKPSNHLILCCPFFSHLQSSPASGSFPISPFFASGGQSIGVSASALVFPKNIQDWFPLGLTGWISLQSKGFSRVFSSTTVQKHQFFGAQLSL